MSDDLKAALRASIARAGARLPACSENGIMGVPTDDPPPVTKLPPGKRGGKKRCEADLCAEIIDALVKSGRVLVIRDEKGHVVFPHRNVQRRTPYGHFGLGKGSPDIVGIVLKCRGGCQGTFLGIEAKLPSDPEPDPHQLAWHAAARSAGACIIVARSADEAISGLP